MMNSSAQIEMAAFGDRGASANVRDLSEEAAQNLSLSSSGPMRSEAKDADSATRTNLADTS